MINTAFFAFGFIAVIAQTLMLRQMLVVFGGNELSVGLILAEWLLGSTLGSYASSIFMPKRAPNFRLFTVFSFILIGIYLAVLFPALSNIRSILNLLPGQLVGIPGLFAASFSVIFPLSFIAGCQFGFGARWAETFAEPSFAWKIYFWESAGFMSGGALFTFALIKALASVQIILAVAFLCLVFAGFFFFKKMILRVIYAAALAVLSFFLIPILSVSIEQYSNKKLYPGFNVLELNDTPYGQLAVLEREKQEYFLSDGSVQGTFPSEETEFTEAFCAIPLVYRPSTVRVLVLGGSGKYTSELSGAGSLKLDYIEADPYSMRLLRKFLPDNVSGGKNVRLIFEDGRNYTGKTESYYDAVYLGFSYPSTILVNRFYTKEFFKNVRRMVGEKGILAFKLPGSEVYMGNELLALTDVLTKTAGSVFKNVKLIPGDETIVLASGAPFESDEKKLFKNFEKLPFRTNFVSESYLNYRLVPQKEKKLENDLAKFESGNSRWNFGASKNTDFTPAAVKDSLVYLYSLSAVGGAKVVEYIYRYVWVLWIALLGWLLSRRMGVFGTSFTSGAAGMGLQITSIIALQILAGNIYSLVGISNAVFMGGLSLGAVAFWRYSNAIRVKNLEMAFVLWICLLLGLFWLKAVNVFLVFLFSAGSGFIVGVEFPALVSFQKNKQKAKESVSAGKVYALDLFGGCFGALIIGIFMVPSLGIYETLFFLIILKITSLLWWVRQDQRNP